MDYNKIYDKIMYRAQTRDNNALLEVERHHVIPRSEGGSSKKTNLVELTLKEHFLAHMLLIRMGKCTKYCYRHLKSSREYIIEKRKERKKKGLYYEEDQKNTNKNSQSIAHAILFYIYGKKVKI